MGVCTGPSTGNSSLGVWGLGDGWERSEKISECLAASWEHPKVSDWIGLHDSSLLSVQLETMTLWPYSLFLFIPIFLISWIVCCYFWYNYSSIILDLFALYFPLNTLQILCSASSVMLWWLSFFPFLFFPPPLFLETPEIVFIHILIKFSSSSGLQILTTNVP